MVNRRIDKEDQGSTPGDRERSCLLQSRPVRKDGEGRRAASDGVTAGFSGNSGKSRSDGFTLIETLLALFLAATVLVSVNMFVFSMGELWGRGGDDRLFDRHVNGVTRFLQNNINHATVRMRTDGENGAQGNLSAAYVTTLPYDGGMGDLYIAFELMESPGIFLWPENPLPFVVCYLEFSAEDGLALLWHSRLEQGFEDDPPRRTLLTPFAREPVYQYYDPESETWSERSDFELDDEGEEILPDRIRIPFVSEKRETERIITLSGRKRGVLSSVIRQ